jgi:hypothetical protein
MGMPGEFLGRTADDWFADALRWFFEEHQGCPCCRERHCVFRAQWGCRVEFYCTACDFSVAQDGGSKRCAAGGGDVPPVRGLLLEPEMPVEIRASLS